jgi:LemA protein
MVLALLVLVGLIVVIAIVIAIWFVSTQRELVNLDELCKNAISQIEVQLNSRFDAIIALAKTAAKYAEHESQTIIQTIQARGGNANGVQPGVASAQALNQQADLLGQMMGRLNVVFERYPELKASELYENAQNGQREYEENVRMSRMIYNDTATKMNRMVRQWPSSIVAGMLHFDVKEYLKVDDEKKRAYPDLDEAFKK